MASELRWILAAIGVPLLFAIWWWSARRAQQAPGNAQLRESVTTEPAAPQDAQEAARAPRFDIGTPGGTREWSISPLQPLSIRTADFESAATDDLPMSAYPADIPVLPVSDAVEHVLPVQPTPAAAAAEAAEPAAHAVTAAPPVPSVPPSPPSAATPLASVDSAATGANRQAPNASEMQRIVGVRVCATGTAPWDGTALMTALENHGMAFGRYRVFHRRHGDGRSLFCAASLKEPGTFDLASMAQQQFLGLTLFAVLPGPAEPIQTFDALIRTAVGLARDLHGTVQDSTGVLLTPLRLEEMREDVARIQAVLAID